MPLSVNIFNKKILSSQSKFGMYDILLSGDADGNAYPNTNPSGFITSKNVVYTTGNQIISGNKIFADDITIQGAALVNQVIDITTTGSISGITGEFKYIKTEGATFSGGNIDFYAESYNFSGVDVNFYGDEYLFSGVNISIVSGTGFFTSKPLVNNVPVLLSGEAYPLNNPSGFVTGAVVRPSETGIFYPRNNPSGYITGIDLSNYATITNLAITGSTLQTSINNVALNLATTGSNLNIQINNLSGTLTGNYATNLNLQSTGQNLNQKIDNLSGYSTGTFATINNLNLTGSTLQQNINIVSGNLGVTGQNLQSQIDDLSVKSIAYAIALG